MSHSKSYDPKLSHSEWGGAISSLGIKKANTKFWQLIILGILGGLYISFGGHLFLTALANGAGKIMASFMFSIGLVLVVVAGAELFTGNIIMIVGIFSGRIRWHKLLKNWGAVYLGNLIGSVAYALLMWESGLFGRAGEPNTLGLLAASVAGTKVALPFAAALIRGIFCNMLVILGIIMSIMAKDVISKILCCMLPVAAFVTLGFEHCVANMFIIPIGYLSAGVPLSGWIAMVPGLLTVTLGNIIGGILIIVIHPNRLRQLTFLRKNKEA